MSTRRDEIEVRLRRAFSPLHLELVDESYQHNVAADAESHWNLLVVAAAFEGQGRIQRQRIVHRALGKTLIGQIHALTMKTLTPEEWSATRQDLHASPPCLGS